MVLKYMFFTKGVGIHRLDLASFELTLRKAGSDICIYRRGQMNAGEEK